MKQRPAAFIGAAGILMVDATLGLGASAHAGLAGSEAPPVPSMRTQPFAGQVRAGTEASVISTSQRTWRSTGSMTTARSGHTATLLRNGTVLAAGGGPRPDGRPGNGVELYHPKSGRWTTADSMSRRRFGHIATRLRNGRILVAGGDNGEHALRHAEVYNPKNGTWHTTGSLNQARQSATVTRLRNGTVLVVGGISDRKNPVLATAELYHPRTGRWTMTGRMSTPRWSHTATLLRNGKVLVAGGAPAFDDVLATAELFNPKTGRWTTIDPMTSQRSGATATLLKSGRVLVAGGWRPGGLKTSELYDPSTGTWRRTGDLRDSREGAQTAVRLPDGRVLLTGGLFGPNYRQRATAEIFHPSSGTWTRAGTMAVPRTFHTATLLLDGDVLVAGGHKPRRSAELYHR